MMRSLSILFAVLTLLMVNSGWSEAAQCNITTTPLNFGVYDPLSSTTLQSNGTLDISCKIKRATLVTVTLTSGTSGSYAQRSMSATTPVPGTLLYNIYLDSGLSTVLGDGSGGSGTLSQSVDKNNPWNVTIYGAIPPLQNIPAGSYLDTITATILW